MMLILVVIVVVLIICTPLLLYWMLFEIISKATYADKMFKEQLRQSLYLEAIARKLGVSDNEIEAINTTLEDIKK